MKKYSVYEPNISGNEKKYVNECIDSTWISSKGHFVQDFEEKFKKYIGTSYAYAVCNGTVAIHLALKALDIKQNDEVICPTFTYIASANPVIDCNGKVIFADSDLKTWQIDPDDIECRITSKTKAIIAVHLYGCPCNMKRIMQIAKKYNIYVIEDCAEAIGSEIDGYKVGSFGDISCFSFFANKTITCGEGGMVLTSNKLFAEKIKKLKTQGVSEIKEYWHDIHGYNYRMTNIQAAIGLAQFERVQEFIDKKIQLNRYYRNYLSNLPIEFHDSAKNSLHTHWMNTILVKNENIRNDLREYLRINNIETRPTFYPIHTMPMYNTKEHFPVAESIAYRGINLPSYPNLEEEDIVYISNKIRQYFGENK